MELGALGLAAFLLGALLLAHEGAQRLRASELDLLNLTLGSVLALSVAAVHMLFDAPGFRPCALVLMAGLSGTLLRPGARTVPVPPIIVQGMWVAAGMFVLIVGGLRMIAAHQIPGPRASIEEMRAAQAWFPFPNIAQKIITQSGAASRCNDSQFEVEQVRRWAPNRWGALEVAHDCALKNGDPSTAAQLRQRILEIEPHWLTLRSGRPDVTPIVEPQDDSR